MLKNISIAKKLPVLFAAMTTISVASVGVMSYVQMSNTIESDAIANVVAVEESMGQSLDKQFELIDADLRVLENYNLTRDALVRFNSGNPGSGRRATASAAPKNRTNTCGT